MRHVSVTIYYIYILCDTITFWISLVTPLKFYMNPNYLFIACLGSRASIGVEQILTTSAHENPSELLIN